MKSSVENNLLNLIMAFPAIEEFALSSLGYMWLNKLAEEQNGIFTQRASTDSIPNIKTFDAISFSLSFDFDFMDVFEIMEKLHIPFFADKRGENSPFVFAGGPVITTNPEPYSKFFDFMIIGDGEETFIKVLDILKNNDKKSALEKLHSVEGVYFSGEKVKKATANLEKVIYTPIVSEKSYFKNTFIIELARGCMNRCAFCTASYINLPFRNYSYEKIIEAIDFGLSKTNKIALLGAQISAHPQFEEIIDYISTKDIELGVSSLRVDAINPKIVQALVKGGQKTSTIAIEAASERLRKLINKNLKEETILDAIKISRENGLKGLKIYSMIGIPTETEEDIDEFLRLAKKIKEENKGFGIEFSFSTFVPKPQTPFQWEKREDTKSLEKKQKYLEKELSKIGVKSKFSSAKWDYWQTVLSRGNSDLAEFLVEVYRLGGQIGAYKKALKTTGIDITKCIEGFVFNETLPWDNIEIYPPKELLIKECERLFQKYVDTV